MEALSKTLFSSVSAAFEEFADRLCDEFKLERAAVVAVWNKAVPEDIKIAEKKSAPAKKAAAVSKPKAKKDAAADSDEKSSKCIYVYQKGAKENEACGSKASEESKSGLYCKKHISHEGKKEEGKKEKKPAAKKAGGKKAEAKEVDTDAVKSLQQASPVCAVKMNKHRRYEHSGTGLLFDRKTEEVYGREDGKGGISPLTAEDIALAKQNGFKYRMPEKLTSVAESKEEDEEDEIDESEVEEEEDDEDEE